MLRNLIETLQRSMAERKLNKEQETRLDQVSRVFKVMPTDAELEAIEAFRNLGATKTFRDRLGQAAQLEAHAVSEELFAIFLRIAGTGKITRDDLNQLNNHGIRTQIAGYEKEHATRQVSQIGQTARLQTAVKQLAFIAGPGFTTQHLIDEGIIHEGDI